MNGDAHLGVAGGIPKEEAAEANGDVDMDVEEAAGAVADADMDVEGKQYELYRHKPCCGGAYMASLSLVVLMQSVQGAVSLMSQPFLSSSLCSMAAGMSSRSLHMLTELYAFHTMPNSCRI